MMNRSAHTHSQQNSAHDFSKGSVSSAIISQAIPLTLAQLVQLLYNIVDRVYIGHLPGTDNMALTGVGLVFPLTTLIAAFTYLYGTGGAPLFSIERGRKNEQKAEKILGNTFTLLLLTSLILMTVCYIFRRPVLYLFGAGDRSYVYANAYLLIYLAGTPFNMLTVGLNGFINAQGFPRIGMATTIIGAALNLALDPLFIFALHMGVSGAALATVISQCVSAVWALHFLCGRKALLRLRRSNFGLESQIVKKILALGLAGFVMQATNSLVQILCNATLKIYGGDLYVGIMTVLNSVREILALPVSGITSGAQPVLGYNYGAGCFDRVKKGIRLLAGIGTAYTLAAWAVVFAFPHFFISIFTGDPVMIADGAAALRIYFFGFFFMSFQFVGQSTFTSLGYAKHAVFFSIFRKVVIVAPLTLLLPRLGLGVDGIFWAEPISNAVGGTVCLLTMYLTVYRKLGMEN